jgi:hypothetical protein
MKRIEKELLLSDFENVIIQYEKRLSLLNNIIIIYTDENKLKETLNDESINENENLNKEFIGENNTNENSELILKEDLIPKDIKVIYHKIMMMTHPDKTNGNNNSKEYNEIYKNAINAKNNNNKEELIYIAYKLNIKEIFEINDDYFNNIKYKIVKLNNDTKNIENNPYWVWYYTDNESLKKIMENQINKNI